MKLEQVITLNEASQWVTEAFGIEFSPSNVSYLVQYGHLEAIRTNGSVGIRLSELKTYFEKNHSKEKVWKERLGDLHWNLSFEQIKEKERTKHVHRLHPYKGKFIPQLVEYFLDDHIDSLKKQVYFRRGDIVLDPFCGSGTTLVQANELGLHAVGIDISAFNSMLSNLKVQVHDIQLFRNEIEKLVSALSLYTKGKQWTEFSAALDAKLSDFNKKFFPSPEFRYRFRRGEVLTPGETTDRANQFLPIYRELVQRFSVSLEDAGESFNTRWLLPTANLELSFLLAMADDISNPTLRQLVNLVISRAVRSARATTHSDLGTLKSPTKEPYYCTKHYKICKPIFSISNWFSRYAKDTIARLLEFEKLRTSTLQYCLVGDSRRINLYEALGILYPELGVLIEQKGIRGIFSSPPYVGLIDYHEQHAYAYEIFKFTRRDDAEIGALSSGTSSQAKNDYVLGISQTLRNCERFLQPNFDIFLVANDKFDLYPQIAELAGLKIENRFVRPVLNRTEKDKSVYAETIFHLKKK